MNARARASRLEASTTRDKWADGKRHRKLFQDAWLALLRAPFPSDVFRKALTRLHTGVIPHAPNPALLSDFCTKSIDRGGLDGMLALNAIFVLMTQHSLEYPKFYDRLYTLLRALRVSRRRSRRVFPAPGRLPAHARAPPPPSRRRS